MARVDVVDGPSVEVLKQALFPVSERAFKAAGVQGDKSFGYRSNWPVIYLSRLRKPEGIKCFLDIREVKRLKETLYRIEGYLYAAVDESREQLYSAFTMHYDVDRREGWIEFEFPPGTVS